jgi:hypothetical protein
MVVLPYSKPRIVVRTMLGSWGLSLMSRVVTRRKQEALEA